MADKEHPAAKAGRYVRAAGLVLGREIDRRTQPAAAPPPPPPEPVPPPPARTDDLPGKAAFGLFVASLVIVVLILLHVGEFMSGSSGTIVQLVLAGVLLVEAALLTTNWNQANERVGQRLLNKVWGRRGAMNRRERGFARAVRDALTFAGILFLAAGVYQLIVAFVGT